MSAMVTTTWDVKYTIYAPTTVTLGKTGIPWNTDGAYTSKKGGLNALFFAVQKHDLESARILLDAGLDVNQPAADGTTPLLAALYNWDPPDLTFVPGKGAPAQAGSSQHFHADLAMARLLLDRGAKSAGADGAGYTPLHGAALAVANATLGPDFRRGGAYGGKAALLTLGRVNKAAPASQVEEALAIVAHIAGRRSRSEPADAISNCWSGRRCSHQSRAARLVRLSYRSEFPQSRAVEDDGASAAPIRIWFATTGTRLFRWP